MHFSIPCQIKLVQIIRFAHFVMVHTAFKFLQTEHTHETSSCSKTLLNLRFQFPLWSSITTNLTSQTTDWFRLFLYGRYTVVVTRFAQHVACELIHIVALCCGLFILFAVFKVSKLSKTGHTLNILGFVHHI